MTPSVLGNADTAGFGDAFEPSRDIYTVTENVLALHDDVADVDANPKLHTPILRKLGVVVSGGALYGDSATNRVNYARELHQHAIAGGLDDSSAVFGDGGVDQFAAECLEARECAFLVEPNEPA